MLTQRFQKQLKSIVPDVECIKKIYSIFEEELNSSLNFGNVTNVLNDIPKVRIVDTKIEGIATRKEDGTCYCLSIEPQGIRAAKITLCSKETTSKVNETVFVPFTSNSKSTTKTDAQPIVLTDPNVTATDFVQTVVRAIETLIQKMNLQTIIATGDPIKFIMTSCYLIDKSRSRQEFLLFHELKQGEGQGVSDPLCRTDLVYLCNVQLAINKINANVDDVISQTTAGLLASSYECPKHYPSCLVSLQLEDLIQMTYAQPNAMERGFSGNILDVDIANFNGNVVDSTSYCTTFGLPYTIPDFEMKSTSQSQFYRDFEKMTSASYLPELSRRLVLRIFQSEAPESVWVQNSLSLTDCLAILNDSMEHKTVAKVVRNAWEWTLQEKELQIVKKLVVAIFSRSAALVATCLAVIAKKTGRLQPALGGVTVVLMGALASNLSYQSLLRLYLDKIFNRNTCKLLVFYQCSDAALKGAAVFRFLNQ